MINLGLQTNTVIKNLVTRGGFSNEQAYNVWYNSKTRAEIERLGLDYISGMRCYYELQFELWKDPRWMNEPFGM